MAEAPVNETSSENTPQPVSQQERTNRGSKFLLWFGQAIVPLLLGSFLFSGILEGYKSSLGDKKDIIDSYYRPMRMLQASCAMQHQQLANQYGELAANYQLQFGELTHMLTEPESSASLGYEIIPKTIANTTRELSKTIHESNVAVRQCHVDLYIKYEELALVTGTYDKFKRLASTRDKRLGQVDRQLLTKRAPYLAAANTDEMMKLLRKLAISRSDKLLDQTQILKEIGAYANPAIELNRLLMTNELDRFGTEQAFFTSTRNLFAREISSRQSKGFFSYLF
ncbi:hypothetical protein [Pseudomonas sp. TNT2022 ID642]|uniref:hypothetical protein n=1 Tax=Pseudomonas sp. TNT2022 ID642 TaxID=2942632 RepID=UPI00235E35AB|nr:hypothetical protein [Pseudomonas sp. TNT2022 ID642]MDD1001888.1 hypothetical protein [Pseudomonas sp. TNT2022 ID642]